MTSLTPPHQQTTMTLRVLFATLCCIALALVFVSSSPSETITTSHVSTKFKAPNENTPPNLARQWKENDDALWDYVSANVPDVLTHTGSAAFDEHLKGVQAVLRYGKAPDYLASAGLFHSIYGTEGFQGFALPLSKRKAIQSLIGEKAEKLAFWFCMVDRYSMDKTVMDWKEGTVGSSEVFRLRARPELGRFELTLNKGEWIDFVELTLADWLEQVEGAATKPSSLFLWKEGEAYAYRRLAYRKMSQILAVERPERLSEIPREMLQQVMATEHPSTRHLVQLRTPPMSEAAAIALEALRAVGEEIPTDLSPQSDDSRGIHGEL